MDENRSSPIGELPPKKEILQAAYVEEARYLKELKTEFNDQQKRRAHGYLVLKILLGAAAVAWVIRLFLRH